MFALIIICIADFLVVFGIIGWLYLDHKRNKEEIADYFKRKYGGFESSEKL
ncbi:MAG: hypothetical protein ACOH1X_02900 [Kaistella sp.]